MKLENFKMEPLKSKHYSTDIPLEVNGNNFLIRISGNGTKPSKREIDRGWEPEHGMDHTESEEHTYLASLILLKLTEED